MPRTDQSVFRRFVRRNWHIALVALSIVVFFATLGGFFYIRGQTIMEQQLKEKLRIAAATAAMQFSPDDLALITDPASMELPVYRAIVERLQRIRDEVHGIDFAYIMRPTEDPNTLMFVVDADSLLGDFQLDRDANGVVDSDEEASYPGDLYDVTDIPALQGPAFVQSTVDEEITVDQWGSLISGYAPIRDTQGRAVAVLGLDMRAEEFIRLTRTMFSPVAFLLVLKASALIALYVFWAVVSRRIDSIRQMDDERSSLLQLALHRLGTPLTIFKWSLEMLQECTTGGTCSKENVDEHLHQMNEGIHRMEEIIVALLAADRAEFSSLRLTPEDLLIQPILDDVVSSVRPLLARKHQRIEVDPDGVIAVRADRSVITGVLHTLVENASVYSPENTVIRIRARKQRGWMRIDVEDEGCGVVQSDLQRIFGRFVRGAKAAKFYPDGNGLGLYVARRLIESAGGRVEIESAGEGKGATATVMLPVIEPNKEKASAKGKTSHIGGFPLA